MYLEDTEMHLGFQAGLLLVTGLVVVVVGVCEAIAITLGYDAGCTVACF